MPDAPNLERIIAAMIDRAKNEAAFRSTTPPFTDASKYRASILVSQVRRIAASDDDFRRELLNLCGSEVHKAWMDRRDTHIEWIDPLQDEWYFPVYVVVPREASS